MLLGSENGCNVWTCHWQIPSSSVWFYGWVKKTNLRLPLDGSVVSEIAPVFKPFTWPLWVKLQLLFFFEWVHWFLLQAKDTQARCAENFHFISPTGVNKFFCVCLACDRLVTCLGCIVPLESTPQTHDLLRLMLLMVGQHIRRRTEVLFNWQ